MYCSAVSTSPILSVTIITISTINGTFTLHWTGTRTGTGTITRNNGLHYIMQNCSHCTETRTGTGTWKFVNGFPTHFSGPEIFPCSVYFVMGFSCMHNISRSRSQLQSLCNVNIAPWSHYQSWSCSPSHAVWTCHKNQISPAYFAIVK